MKVIIKNSGKNFSADLSKPIDLSIPLDPEKPGVNAFYAPHFSANPVTMGNFIGAVSAGAPINFFNIMLSPHGNGTHTECVGHITAEKFTINQCLKNFFFIAQLISIQPQKIENGDSIITKKQVEDALRKNENDNEKKFPFEALIIRTLPNDVSKLSKNYSGKNPPYLHHEIAELLLKLNVKHLLIDLPSADREEDDGKLLFHKKFWRFPDAIRKDATITELIFAPDEAEDGFYFLNLQIASFETDAVPSKPILFKLIAS